MRGAQCEVGEYVVGGYVDIYVVVVSDDEGSVSVFVVNVVFGGLMVYQCGVIVGVEPLHSVDIEGGVVYVEDFEFVVFVACREY